MHFPSRKTGWKSREIMDNLVQEHPLAKRHWNLAMVVIKQSVVLQKGWKYREIFHREKGVAWQRECWLLAGGLVG